MRSPTRRECAVSGFFPRARSLRCGWGDSTGLSASRAAGEEEEDGGEDEHPEQNEQGDLDDAPRGLADYLAGLAIDQEAIDLLLVAIGGNPHREQHVFVSEVGIGVLHLQVSLGIAADIAAAALALVGFDAHLRLAPA